MTEMTTQFEGARLGGKRGFEPVMIVGLVMTVLLHGTLFVGVYLYREAEAKKRAAMPPPPGKYVVAKLVRLGKKRDPKKLPDREAPRMPTKKVRGVNLDADASDKGIKRKKKPRNRHAVVRNDLNASFDKIRPHAEIQPDKEVEGDPNGSKYGTYRKGSKGDLYYTRIADMWNRTWSLPAIIQRADAKKLFVQVIVKIDAAGNIQFPVKFTRSSGNEHFDNSIRTAWKRIRKLPLPPEERKKSVLAHGLKLRLTWRGIR
jgi:hypothetical protein